MADDVFHKSLTESKGSDPDTYKEPADFRNELREHPDLLDYCQGLDSFSFIIARIATEVGVIVDGYYDDDALKGLLRLLTHKLVAKRKPIITSLRD